MPLWHVQQNKGPRAASTAKKQHHEGGAPTKDDICWHAAQQICSTGLLSVRQVQFVQAMSKARTTLCESRAGRTGVFAGHTPNPEFR